MKNEMESYRKKFILRLTRFSAAYASSSKKSSKLYSTKLKPKEISIDWASTGIGNFMYHFLQILIMISIPNLGRKKLTDYPKNYLKQIMCMMFSYLCLF